MNHIISGSSTPKCKRWTAKATRRTPLPSAIHALTAGATATMIVAVMPRVTRGHTGRELTADRATVAMFVLINAAALARVCASWHTEFMILLLLVAGACWIAAFAVFELIYGAMLVKPSPP